MKRTSDAGVLVEFEQQKERKIVLNLPSTIVGNGWSFIPYATPLEVSVVPHTYISHNAHSLNPTYFITCMYGTF